jgi:hypothetical protein
MMFFGTILQAIGTLLLTLPLWGTAVPLLKNRIVFSTSAGMLTDSKGWWPCLAKTGLALYMFGYLLIFFGWNK